MLTFNVQSILNDIVGGIFRGESDYDVCYFLAGWGEVGQFDVPGV